MRYLLFGFLLYITCGCASVGNYFLNRLSDFGDCFTAEAGVGYGLDFHILATNLISTGVGASYIAKSAGVSHGVPYSAISYHLGLPLLPFMNFLSREWRKEWWVTDTVHRGLPRPTQRVIRTPPPGYLAKSVLFVNLMSISPPQGPGTSPVMHGYPNSDMAIFDFEVSFTVGVLYLRLGFSIGEFVDFLLGWFGVDIAGDDKVRR